VAAPMSSAVRPSNQRGAAAPRGRACWTGPAGAVLACAVSSLAADAPPDASGSVEPARPAVSAAAASWRAWQASTPRSAVVLSDWRVASPFAVTSVDGIDARYPPDQGVDLEATYAGSGDATIAWKRLDQIEGAAASHTLGKASAQEARLSYLYRTLKVAKGCTVAVGWSCTERWAMALNGERIALGPAIAQAPAQGLVFELPLREGQNQLLIKVYTRKGTDRFSFCFKSPAVLEREAEEQVLSELCRNFPLGETQEILLERQAAEDYELLREQMGERGHWRKVTPLAGRLDAVVWDTDRDPLDVILRRTHKLVAALSRGPAAPGLAPVRSELEGLAAAERALPVEDTGRRRAQYLAVHGLNRRAALLDPRLDFDAILFAKAAPTSLPHMSDQFYGWWARPGGGLFVLEGFKGDQARVRCLTADLPDGSYLRPELSPDGQRVLFAYARYYPHVAKLKNKRTKANLPEDAFYHLYEARLDGTGRRQLTRGRYDDFDGRYLPSGEILFLSTRKGVFLQTSEANTTRTLTEDLPDSYVRCGGDDYRPVPVFTLHALEASGGRLRPVSAFENFEYTPALAQDGRLLYTRWDYIDRFNGHFFSLWSTSLDGTQAQLVYGNYTVNPQAVCEAVPIPGSTKLAFVATAHHSVLGGSLVLLDRTLGTEGDRPIRRLTPEVPFPEAETNVSTYYANPHPLSEDLYLVAWGDRPLPPHGARLARRGWPVAHLDENPLNPTGLYLYDTLGNRSLLYRDPAIASVCPVPVRPRTLPPVPAAALAFDARPGAFLVQDIYAGLDAVARGTIKRLRVVGVPPKVQPYMNKPVIGVSEEDVGKYVIGTVPVEEDGSAYLEVPSGVPVFFQALDAEGIAVQTMRSLTYVVGNQTVSCIGCHESRETAPPPGARSTTLASRREPSRPALDPPGSWPLEYGALVQPVLDQQCVACHRPGGGERSERFDLTAGKSYQALLDYAGEDLRKLAKERDRSVAGEGPAAKSKLLAFLRAGHAEGPVRLEAALEYRLVTWMDLYAPQQGSFSEEQARELEQFKSQWLSDNSAE